MKRWRISVSYTHLMVAELVETSRLWGRIAARIDPEWVEPVAQHLIKRTYSEPVSYTHLDVYKRQP